MPTAFKAFSDLISYEIFGLIAVIKSALTLTRGGDVLVTSRKRLDCFGYTKAILQNAFPFAFFCKIAGQFYCKVLGILYSDVSFGFLD